MRLSLLLLKLISFTVATAALVVAGTAQATNYGNLAGATVVFTSVDDVDDLFGAPTVTGDTMDFNPTDFEANCPAGAGETCGLLEGQLVFGIEANAGSFLDEILLTEAGDTALGTFVSGDLAATSVAATLFIDIFEIDGIAVNGINGNAEMIFTDGGAYFRDDSSAPGTDVIIWTGSLLLDLDAMIAAAGQSGRATGVSISMNNFLNAFANGSATASIEKKDVDGLAITVIPEPGTALLLGLGLTGLASLRSKRGHPNL